MKPGDLIRFKVRHSIVRTDVRIGLWLSMRYTKWSRDLPFHKVLVEEGIIEVPLWDGQVEVISEAG